MLRDNDELQRLHRLKILQRIFMVLMLLICVTSDYFLLQQYVVPSLASLRLIITKNAKKYLISLFSVYLLNYKLLRHFVDSAAHGSVAFCCWVLFLLQIEKCSESGDSILKILKKCFFNGITASLLDVDHFIAAGALNLAGATHLNGRPFGHAVTFIIAVAMLVSRWSRKCQARTRRYRVCFVVVAWFSHQLRDGMRRGLWFWPLGSTPPINYFLYLFMEEALPFVMAKWWSKAPALTEMEKLELALQNVVAESDEGEEVNNSDEEEGARLLTLDTKERASSPTKASATSPRQKHSDFIV
ncbi:hypothetical protein JG688_00002871 [Phytophthora aleatoria]|uniref:Transmembrane protein 267 n=1 Tax=Phytophthora aleatoria TaxID=2496075 RepID=A0A8J5JBV7_9STRA|nr:hypothetical protein JG688_00002871 [Phytophthora aleatoria]